MIPKKIIFEKEYVEKYSDKFLYIITELIFSEDKKGFTRFSLEDLIITLGIKPRWGEGRINEQIKSIIELMIENNMLLTNVDMEKTRIDKLIKCKFQMPYDVNNDGKPTNWFKVELNDYLKILNDESKLNKFTLISIYYYILAKIIKRNDGIDNIHITGGSAEVYWDNQESISKTLKISRNTFTNYVNKLNELGLIHYGNIGKVTKDGIVRKANNVYATKKDELKYGLEQSKYYWENQGWKLINKSL